MLAPRASWADTGFTKMEMEISKTHRGCGTEKITSGPKRERVSCPGCALRGASEKIISTGIPFDEENRLFPF